MFDTTPICNPLNSDVVIPMPPGLIMYQDSSSESSSSSMMSSGQEPPLRGHDEMKARVEMDLKSATYQADLTTEGAILHADPNTVQTILDRLRCRHKLTAETLTAGGNSSVTNPRFPSDGFEEEDDSYEPLAHLLNKIVAVAGELSQLTESHLNSLRFYHFGDEVDEKYGCYKGLRPNGLGIIGELPIERAVSWEEIEVIIEAKRRIKHMVQHAAMYARCCLLNNRRRFFSLAIGFNFESLEVYVLVFHRSGLSSSRPLGLKEEQGFKDLVRHMVGILSTQGEAAYGLDITRSQNEFFINNRHYRIVHHLYLRDDLRGRATAVYGLDGRYSCGFCISLMYHCTYPTTAHTKGSLPLGLQSRMLSCSEGVTDLPDKIVYKLAYPIKGQSQEGPLFSRYFGQFGVFGVLGYHNCGPEESHGSMEPFFRSTVFWDIFESKHHKHKEADRQRLSDCGRREPEREKSTMHRALCGGATPPRSS